MRIVNRSLTRLYNALLFSSTIASAGLAVGCGEAPMDEEEIVGASEESLYVASSSLWIPSRHNRYTSLSVCFEGTTDTVAMGWVRDAITATWDASSSLKFYGWGICTGGELLRVKVQDLATGPRTDDYGVFYGAIYLNFTFANWGASCAGAARQGCIQTIAIHEFGHAIGLVHEQNRPGFTVCPSNGMAAAPQARNGDLSIGVFDHASVMSYCPEGEGTGWLSADDSANIKKLYGPLSLSHDQKLGLRAQSSQYMNFRFDGANTFVQGGSAVEGLRIKRRLGAGGFRIGDEIAIYSPNSQRYVCFGWVTDSSGNPIVKGISSTSACYFKMGHTNGPPYFWSSVDVNSPFVLTASFAGRTYFLGIDQAYLAQNVMSEWRLSGPF